MMIGGDDSEPSVEWEIQCSIRNFQRKTLLCPADSSVYQESDRLGCCRDGKISVIFPQVFKQYLSYCLSFKFTILKFSLIVF